MDWTCTSRMKSMPGSARAMPLQGQVKFVPSMRNWFSLVPEPNAETVVARALDGEVGEIPGRPGWKSNMLARRVGIALRSSGPNLGSKSQGPALRCASPLPGRRSTPRRPHLKYPPSPQWWSPRRLTDIFVVGSQTPGSFDVEHGQSREAEPGSAVALSRPLATAVAGPPISAGELTRIAAPGSAPPCASFTPPISDPVGSWRQRGRRDEDADAERCARTGDTYRRTLAGDAARESIAERVRISHSFNGRAAGLRGGCRSCMVLNAPRGRLAAAVEAGG